MNLTPIDQMPMMLTECAQAAVYVQGRFSDELPVSRFTADALGEQALMLSRAAEEADAAVPAFWEGEASLRAELEDARKNLDAAEQRLEEARAIETHSPCTGCHLVRMGAIAVAEERLWWAKKRLRDAEEALETMESVLAILPGMEWVGPSEEVMTILDRFDPQSAGDMRGFLVIYRDSLEDLAQCTARVGEQVGELPRKFFSGVRGHIGELTRILIRTGGHADETEIEFRRLHETEIARLDDPRPREEVWDIGQNSVASPQVDQRPPRSAIGPASDGPGQDQDDPAGG